MEKLKTQNLDKQLLFSLICFFCFQTADIQAQCITPGTDVWTQSWVSCQKTNNPNPVRAASHWVLFEFPTAENITESHIWNANRTGDRNKGAKVIGVDYSVDGTNWIFWGNVGPPKGPGTDGYLGVPGPNFGGVFIKKILFTVQSTYGDGSCASLAEVKFTIDQTACYGEIDECGICNGEGQLLWHKDEDGDGLGDPLESVFACTQPAGYVINKDDVCDDVAYGWDVIGQLFEDNQCTQCHGPAAAGGLDLSSYETALAGGNKCGSLVWRGTRLASIILDDGYSGCSSSISAPSMNFRIGQFGESIDTEELSMIQAWIDSGATKNCDCDSSDPDADGDGVCDQFDACPQFNNNLIGTGCDDGNICTINDVYTADCNCEGIPALDTDNDGVCDSQDAMPLNACTADGIIDGIEPFPWTGSQSNDCDGDGIILAQGDFDDFSACIDNVGYVPSVSCECGSSALTAGGLFDRIYGTITNPNRASGMPDGLTTNFMGFNDTLSLSFPSMQKGDEICISLEFVDIDGLVTIDLNGLGKYRFPNTTGIVNEPQEFCFKTINDGPQTILIREDGVSGIRVDGSTYSYCPCTPSDPLYNTAACQCPTNQEQTAIEFESHIGVGEIPEDAAGLPDGIFTGNISGTDSLILSFPQVFLDAEICITVGFSNPEGIIQIEQSNQIYTFQNRSGNATYQGQEYCFATASTITNNTLILNEYGLGWFRVDGGYMKSCIPCGPNDQDSDGDGICDLNDPCPLSPTGDSDGDGYCDDIDSCQGFDDDYDSDGDGMPNGCDICFGFDDDIDTDGDGVPNGCDLCEGSDDSIDSDGDGMPNGCDLDPCMNFISEITSPLIVVDKAAHIQINTNGYVKNNVSVNYTAGQQLVMDRGFNVEQGSTFHASIGPCSQ